MPWCEHCEQYLTPTSMDADGSCPTCHGAVDTETVVERTERPQAKIPWHFWLLLIAATAYLGWRAIDGVFWLIGQM
ncbi:MAG: hypothetical protein AAFZ07_23910 [Actinomycetota bacterium]